MRISLSIAAALGLTVKSLHASPDDIEARSLTPQRCSKVVSVIDKLKSHSATSFCSSFLGIKTATKTVNSVVTVTSTSTVKATATHVTASTSAIFKPGNPPATTKAARARRAPLADDADSGTPTWLTSVASSAISSACDCLNIPTPTKTLTKSSTLSVARVVTVTVTKSPAVVTKTYYPCATPIPYKTPKLPYGQPNLNENFDSAVLFPLDDPQGTSAAACCNACFFNVTYCVQAYWYSNEGCQIYRSEDEAKSGIGITAVCPQGTLANSYYLDDPYSPTSPQTGDFAGPCAENYYNLPY